MAGRKEVKILQIISGGKASVYEQEKNLTRLLNDGWSIIAAGGGTAKVIADTIGFVILQRER